LNEPAFLAKHLTEESENEKGGRRRKDVHGKEVQGIVVIVVENSVQQIYSIQQICRKLKSTLTALRLSMNLIDARNHLVLDAGTVFVPILAILGLASVLRSANAMVQQDEHVNHVKVAKQSIRSSTAAKTHGKRN
jgi:hypothetical protein